MPATAFVGSALSLPAGWQLVVPRWTSVEEVLLSVREAGRGRSRAGDGRLSRAGVAGTRRRARRRCDDGARPRGWRTGRPAAPMRLARRPCRRSRPPLRPRDQDECRCDAEPGHSTSPSWSVVAVVTTVLRRRATPRLCVRTNVKSRALQRTQNVVHHARHGDAGASRRCSGVDSRGVDASYGAVPTRVLPPAVSAALNVSEVLPLNFGPYSLFWPL